MFSSKLKILIFLVALFVCEAAANAQVPMTGAGIAKPSTGGGGCTQATSYLSGLTTSYTSAYTTMICGMVTDGDFANILRLYIHATDTSAAALKDIIAGGTVTISGSATFTANNGYVTTTGLFDTGLDLSTAWTATNGGMLAWTTGGATNDNNCPIGETSPSFDINLIPFSFGGGMAGAINGVSITGTTANATGLFAAEINATQSVAYKNGASVGTTTGTGTLTSSGNHAQGWSCAGSGSNYAENIAMVGVTKTLGSTAQLRVYNRIHTFLNTVNATLFP